MRELERQPIDSQELLDEESLAVLAILLALSLEFGFGFAKTVDWWAGPIAGPAALATDAHETTYSRTRRCARRALGLSRVGVEAAT